MILSVSRRTDIIGFYSDWFFNRLKEGYVLVRNPMNYHQVGRIQINPDIIDCIVFWTKNPKNILGRLDLLKAYNYYFQVTINPYDNLIESKLPLKKDIISAFKDLSEIVGKERMIWRYDPIIISEEIDFNYHRKNFKEMANSLEGYTEKCIFGFLYPYKKTIVNMKDITYKILSEEKAKLIAYDLYLIGKTHNISLEACSEEIDFSNLGIRKAKCIDDDLISKIIGERLIIPKDKNQRDSCACVTSIDIGAYNSCGYGCKYCYANYNDKVTKKNMLLHDKESPFLIGNLEEGDVIKGRKMESYRKNQLSLF